MRYRISAFLAALGIVLLGASATAIAKPAVAVLGLEVIDSGTGIDAKTTELAKLLTEALRKRAQLSNSPYDLAPNSEKDLLEMKLLSGCADEARACMANIGRELKAARLVYGKVERRDTGYQVSLKLLNVESKSMERSTSDVIPFADNNPPAVNNKWSRVLFNRLTGIPEQGNLVVQANVTQGSVYVDGEVATGLNGGRARVDGLAEGAHTVAVEADGHDRFETEVTVTAGQTTEIDAQLESLAVDGAGDTGIGSGSSGGARPADQGRPGGVWRVLFWSTAVTTVAGTAAASVTGLQTIGVIGDLEDNKIAAIEAYNETATMPLDQGDACKDARDQGASDVVEACEAGDARARLATTLWIATGVSAVAAAAFGYMGYIDSGSQERRTAQAGEEPSDEALVRFAPTITPNYLGAGLTIEF